MARSASVYDHCDSPLPVPAGKSPFRIKGEFYRHLGLTITAVNEKSGGALLKVFDREGIAAFQRQPFVSGALYDNLPLPRMVMAIAEVTGKDLVALTTKMGRTAGERQLKGIYNKLISEMTLRTFSADFKTLIEFFYDYGPVTITYGADALSLKMVRSGMPLALIEWWSLVSIPFLEVPLERHGAQGLEITAVIERTDLDAPIPLGSAVWEMRWRR